MWPVCPQRDGRTLGADVSQLADLAKPLPDKYVHENPSGQGRGSYINHAVISQRLLELVGPFDLRIVELIRGEYTAKDQTHVGVVGCIASLTVTIDGQRVTVEEVGDCEKPSNWPHDGARAKDAISDALKRCAMRLGLGLFLWSQKDGYFLHSHLTARAAEGAVEEEKTP